MTMRYVMGIDGGGSAVRAAVVTPDRVVVGSAEGTGVNPGVVGREQAKIQIRQVARSAIAQAGLSPEQIEAVGVGIAGADAAHAEAWLRDVISGVLPDARVTTVSDHEIALIGAHGERRGVLVMAGTGSLACGANSAGDYVRAGGWGYLLGDEGSGYHLGREALRAVVRAADGRGPAVAFSDAVLAAVGVDSPHALLAWLYQVGQPRVAETAALAEIVLTYAAAGDTAARMMVTGAARELALSARAVMLRLGRENLPTAFAGGLLRAPNPLSLLLCELLGLAEIPQARYAPVVGAAIAALTAGGQPDA